MDPPRQVSRRGPGTGPVFRTFKKSYVPSFPPGHPSSSFSTFNRAISSLPVSDGPVLPRVIPSLQQVQRDEPLLSVDPAAVASIAHSMEKSSMLSSIASDNHLRQTASTAASTVPSRSTTPIAKRAKTNSDQSNIISLNRIASLEKKKWNNEDLILDPRTRGNRGIRTSGVHKNDELALIQSAQRNSANRTSCLGHPNIGMKGSKVVVPVIPAKEEKVANAVREAREVRGAKDVIKIERKMIDKPKPVRRSHGKPHRRGSAADTVRTNKTNNITNICPIYVQFTDGKSTLGKRDILLVLPHQYQLQIIENVPEYQYISVDIAEYQRQLYVKVDAEYQ